MLSIGNGPISWHSKLQNEVAQLTSKVEHHNCVEATKKTLWMWNFFEDIGMPQTKPLVMYCDN
jgi:hypothetical protein